MQKIRRSALVLLVTFGLSMLRAATPARTMSAAAKKKTAAAQKRGGRTFVDLNQRRLQLKPLRKPRGRHESGSPSEAVR